MKSTPSAKELESGCRAMLNKLGIEPTDIKGLSGIGFWILEVEISDRKFIFGSNGREGYSFSEIKDGKEITYIGSDSEPIYGSNDLLWKRSFEIIGLALKDPCYRGQTPIPVI